MDTATQPTSVAWQLKQMKPLGNALIDHRIPLMLVSLSMEEVVGIAVSHSEPNSLLEIHKNSIRDFGAFPKFWHDRTIRTKDL
jgi:hypothetical protein